MNLRAILYGIGALAAASVLARLFMSKYRHASRWLRAALALLGCGTAAWSALGFFLLAQESHLSESRFRTLSHIEWDLAGVLAVLAVVVAIHPEYRKLRPAS